MSSQPCVTRNDCPNSMCKGGSRESADHACCINGRCKCTNAACPIEGVSTGPSLAGPQTDIVVAGVVTIFLFGAMFLIGRTP